MEMRIHLLGKKKVTAEFDGYRVTSDQPVEDGGNGSAPAPFDLFLASIGTCAGFFIQSFCQTRGIPVDGIEIIQRSERDEVKHLVTKVSLEITLPKDFPEKYRTGLVNAANLCTVKKHLVDPPKFEIETRHKHEPNAG